MQKWEYLTFSNLTLEYKINGGAYINLQKVKLGFCRWGGLFLQTSQTRITTRKKRAYFHRLFLIPWSARNFCMLRKLSPLKYSCMQLVMVWGVARLPSNPRLNVIRLPHDRHLQRWISPCLVFLLASFTIWDEPHFTHVWDSTGLIMVGTTLGRLTKGSPFGQSRPN